MSLWTLREPGRSVPESVLSGRRLSISPRLIPFVAPAVCFAISFLYLWLVVDIRLFYESSEWFPPFLLGKDFAAPFFRYPGGPILYLEAFIAQLQYFGWPAALVIAAVIVMLGKGTRAFLNQLSPSWPTWPAYVPVLLTLCVFSRYGTHLASILALVPGVWGAVGYAKLRHGCRRRDLPVFIIGFLVLYFSCGAGAYVFAGLCAALEFAGGRDELLGGTFILVAGFLAVLVGRTLCDLSWLKAIGPVLPVESDSDTRGQLLLLLVYAFFALFLVAAVLSAGRMWWGTADGTKPSPPSAVRNGIPFPKFLLASSRPAKLLLVLIALASLNYAFDRPQRSALLIAHFARMKQWAGVLRTADSGLGDEVFPETTYHIDQALYRQGLLAERMFAYPQTGISLMLGFASGPKASGTLRFMRYGMYYDVGDTFLDMGMVNEVEHDAHEALTRYGPHGEVLRQLAVVNIAKRRPETARIFLRLLRRDLIHRRQAQTMLAQLDSDPLMENDPCINMLRSRMVTEDYAGRGQTVDEWGENMLKANPTNHMAFEYMMCQSLMERRLDVVVKNLHRLNDFGCRTVPIHFQEAVVLYEALTGERAPLLPGLQIYPAVYQAYDSFSRALAPYHATQDVRGGSEALAPNFKGSYFYYYAFVPEQQRSR